MKKVFTGTDPARTADGERLVESFNARFRDECLN
jgi:hypothetical protein